MMREPVYLEDYANALMHLANAKIMPLRLSRADELFVQGIVMHNIGSGLTQPQVDLIRTLVQKYNRQLRKYGIDSEQVKTAQPRFQIRLSQDPTEPYIDFDGTYFKFSFTHRMKNYRDFWNKPNQMKGTFDLEQGIAYPSLDNISILERFAKEFPMLITDRASEVMDQANQFKQKHRNYKMELLPNGNVTHASPELRAHLRKKTAGMEATQKLYWLYDRAYEYGYNVNKILDVNIFKFTTWCNGLIFSPVDDFTFEDIKYYADTVGRKYILWWTTDKTHPLPQDLIQHIHIVKGNQNINPLSITDFDVNKINCCHQVVARRNHLYQSTNPSTALDEGMQFIVDNDLESETLLITNSLKYHTKVKMLTIKNPNGKNNN